MATSIRLDPAIEQRLDHLATETGRTKAYYLRELVTNGLDDLEGYYLAAATMERVRKGEAKRITAFLRQRLATLDDPRSTGKALTGPQIGTYRRYRVGDYRIICDIQDGALCVLVIEVGNRKRSADERSKRL